MLLQDAQGMLYGTTPFGGTRVPPEDVGYGTGFKITTNGILTTLVSFSNTNGAFPRSGLVQTADGNFYGVTQHGGSYTNYTNQISDGCGTVFKITTNNALTSIISFDGTNGFGPNALIRGSDGNLYGTTEGGGASGFGTVFKLKPNGDLTTVFSFTGGTNGGFPFRGLIQATDGCFYGTLSRGGPSTNNYGAGYGSIFRLSIAMQPVFESVTKTGGAIRFTWSAIAGQVYKAQYKSDLNSTNWHDWGSAVTATNGTMSASDVIDPAACRFYRVVLLP